MITLKSKAEIGKMQKAGELLALCHKEIGKLIRPGISTLEIDRFVEEFLKKNGATPEQKGYHGYPFATCAAVNDVICHGFPTKEPLADGDIVSIDMVVNLDGWLADSAWSYAVGNISTEARNLLDITKQLLYKGIEKAVEGNRIGDISNTIQTLAEANGYSVVRDFIGHGIGKIMHEEPDVPHYGPAGFGPRIREGMVFTIEPMINVGSYQLTIDSSNGWVARTKDGSLSAQYEHTIAITANGPLILTEQN
ncbi:MAG TPA: type I methionyl aminopeptidase [Bacillota bacterium]|nr:type I methionyl aminopeptidase [Bacillota bacterium]